MWKTCTKYFNSYDFYWIFFFYEFLNFSNPPNRLSSKYAGKNLRKFSRIHLLTNYFMRKFQNFWTFPFEGMDFWILTIYGHIIRIRVGGSSQNYFGEDFTSILVFWASFSSISESADFTTLCGVTLFQLFCHYNN